MYRGKEEEKESCQSEKEEQDQHGEVRILLSTCGPVRNLR